MFASMLPEASPAFSIDYSDYYNALARPDEPSATKRRRESAQSTTRRLPDGDEPADVLPPMRCATPSSPWP